MISNEKKIKMAVIGSGAIAEEGYLPAAQGLHGLEVSHLVDLDAGRVAAAAERFGIAHHLTDYRGLFDAVDAVVVATPPASHAAISKDMLNHGVHVLCEKPLAMTVEEAKSMVDTAARTGIHLSAGLVRRLAWSAQTMHRLIANGVLGIIVGFDVIEGWEFNWPLRTGHLFKNDNARGVIADTGPHLFDLVLWLLGSRQATVDSCRDDNRGGIEANAHIELAVRCGDRDIQGRMELSFTRRLRNTIKIFGETGCLEASTVGASKLNFYPAGDSGRPIVMTPEGDTPIGKHDGFKQLLQDFVVSFEGSQRRDVPAEEAIAVMEIIEACYQVRRPEVHSWERLHLEHVFGKA